MGITGGGSPLQAKISSSHLHFLSDPLAPVRSFTINHPTGLTVSQPRLSYSSSNGSDHSHVRVSLGNSKSASPAASSGSSGSGSRTSLVNSGNGIISNGSGTPPRKSSSFNKADSNRETFNLTLDFPHHKIGNGNGTLDFPNLKISNSSYNNDTLDPPHVRLVHQNSSPIHGRRKETNNLLERHFNKLNNNLGSLDHDELKHSNSQTQYGNGHPVINDGFFSAGNHKNGCSSHPPKGPSQRKISNRSLHGVFHSRLSGPLASLQPVVGLRPQSTRARKKRHSAIAFFNNKDKENVQVEISSSPNAGDLHNSSAANSNLPSVIHQLATMCRPGMSGSNGHATVSGRHLLGQGLSVSESSLTPAGLNGPVHRSNNSNEDSSGSGELGRARKVSLVLRALAGRLSFSLGKSEASSAAGSGISNGDIVTPPSVVVPPPLPPPRPLDISPPADASPPLPPPNPPLTATLSAVSSSSTSSNGLGVNNPLGNGVSSTDMPQKRMVRAMYDYKAAQKGDLSLVADEEYEVLEETEEHWWKLRDKHGNEGYSPSNYVKESTDIGLHQYDWYLGDATRQRAETILMREEREGCFVVRNSSSTTGMYTISVFCSMSRPQVKHYHIQKCGEGKYYLSQNIKCNSIPELIYKHQYNPGGLCTRLRSAPHGNKPPATAGFSRDKWDIPLNEISLLEEIGSGQFGVVRRGKYRGMDVAVKMMKEGTMSEDEFIEEAKVMTKLQHPNLVQLYGVCKRQRPVYIITEFLEYGSLLHYLRQKEKTLSAKTDTLIDICLQISEGMAYLEKEKFIHRDLAARNCLVGSANIKVGDFGLARYVVDDEYTGSGGAKFPIKWAAPEVLNYMRFSSKSDVWAFGVLMWEVFTCGKMPYGRRKNADVVAMVQEGIVLEQPRYCPNNVYKVMRDCWEQVADQRPSFNDLKTEISRLNTDD